MFYNRFDPELLDEGDPFEIDDDNGPHLAKHSPFAPDDVYEAWVDPIRIFVAPPHPPAEWVLVARVGDEVVDVPLVRSRSGSARRCRPIGIYASGQANRALYQEG